MNVLLLSINCSYSHTSLALPLLQGFIKDTHSCTFLEFTNREKVEFILQRIVESQPDVILTTAYIFNHPYLDQLLSRCKLISPQTQIFAGGPEFLGGIENTLQQRPWLDAIIQGEGELLIRQLSEQNFTISPLKGLHFINEDGYYDGGFAEEITQLDIIPSPYQTGTICLDKPFIQLETSRGCPNKCSFCTSSLSQGVRVYSLDRVRADLKAIEKAGITEIRLLDRTFNCPIPRAIQLLEMIRDEFPKLNFHAEFDPAFVTEPLLKVMKTIPKGQLHLEAGLQSFEEQAYKEAGRCSSLAHTQRGLKALCQLENIEVHSDLIAGLPGTTLQTLADDLHKLTALRPHEIQLEVLKILPGTPLTKRKELISAPHAPYELLQSDQMNFRQLAISMEWSKMYDWYYNHSPWQPLWIKLMAKLPNFLDRFHQYLVTADSFRQPLNPAKTAQLLAQFLLTTPDAKPFITQAALTWFNARFSPEHGPFKAVPWSADLPRTAQHLQGEKEPEQIKRWFKWQNADTQEIYYIGYSAPRLTHAETQIGLWLQH